MQRSPQEYPDDDFGVQYYQAIDFKFLRDDLLNRAKAEGRRIIAVGTTSVRVLEQAAQDLERLNKSKFSAIESEATIFILPGHNFRMVDGMITNFHLPRSSLLMLVSAFIDANTQTNAGICSLKAAYQEAIENRYRFYSFGDAMLIV